MRRHVPIFTDNMCTYVNTCAHVETCFVAVACFDHFVWLQGFDCNNISVQNVNQLHTRFGQLFEEDDIKVIEKFKLPCDGDQKCKMFLRDIIQIFKDWLSDEDLADFMVFEPKVAR